MLLAVLLALETVTVTSVGISPALDQLRPPTLLRLPTGATKPTGWLLRELELQVRH